MRSVMASRLNQNGMAFVLALLLHVIIFFILIMSFEYYLQNRSELSQDKTLFTAIQAVAVNQSVVEKQVAHIKAQMDAKEKQSADVRAVKEEQKVAEQEKLEALEALKFAKEMHEARAQAQLQLAKQHMTELNKLQEEVKAPLTLSKHQASSQAAEETKKIMNQPVVDLNELARYKAMILNAMGKQWIIPPGVDRTLSCQLLIKLDASGNVLNVEVLQSSGNEILDQSAVMAVLKASPLPLPQNPLLLEQFRELQLTLN